MSLSPDILVRMDDEVQVALRTNGDAIELLVFVADVFGGERLGVNPATRLTVNGGMVGEARSPGSRIDGKPGPAREYLFGAGQGPISAVEVDEPEATVQLVNPEIDGWVITVPETIGVSTLPWRLIGTDGSVVFESVGTGIPEFGMKVGDAARAFVRLRDGNPELLIFEPNDFGGASMTVTRADRATVNGGMAGEAASPGYRYLFGAGQGQLKSGSGVQVSHSGTGDRMAEAQGEMVNASGWGWVIAVPDSIDLDSVEWRLVGPEGSVLFEATGLERKRT